MSNVLIETRELYALNHDGINTTIRRIIGWSSHIHDEVIMLTPIVYEDFYECVAESYKGVDFVGTKEECLAEIEDQKKAFKILDELDVKKVEA